MLLRAGLRTPADSFRVREISSWTSSDLRITDAVLLRKISPDVVRRRARFRRVVITIVVLLAGLCVAATVRAVENGRPSNARSPGGKHTLSIRSAGGKTARPLVGRVELHRGRSAKRPQHR